MPHQEGKPDYAGGNPGLNPGKGGGGGKPSGAGTKKGELFGDQVVLYRDLDPSDGGGNGEPEPNPFLSGELPLDDLLVGVGYDPLGTSGYPELNAEDLFPIFKDDDVEAGDYEFPAEYVDYLQEVELERANVSRAPAKVTEKALVAALDKITGAYAAYDAQDPNANLEDYVKTDLAGRIMYATDGVFSTIDAPLENLALYQALMTAGGADGWPEAYNNWDTPIVVNGNSYDVSVFKELVGTDTLQPDWDPSAFLGAAWSKEGEITLDAMLYQHTTMGLNSVDQNTQTVEAYYNFLNVAGDDESYDYSREARYDDGTMLQWVVLKDGEVNEYVGELYDAVFGGFDPETGDISDGKEWVDEYLDLETTGDPSFGTTPAEEAGVNDWAQAADDSRAVIEFLHTYSAVELEVA